MAHLVDSIVKSFCTIKEMLADRRVDASSIEHISEQELYALASENHLFDIDVTPAMKIFYCLLPKFKIPEIRDTVASFHDEAAESTEKKQLIIVTREPPTPANMKSFMDEFEGVDTQFFSLKELQYNIARHALVPHHEVISDPVKIQELTTSYLVKSKGQFPILLRTDPMARYINAHPGDIVQITRASPSAGEYISYRCCV